MVMIACAPIMLSLHHLHPDLFQGNWRISWQLSDQDYSKSTTVQSQTATSSYNGMHHICIYIYGLLVINVV